MGNGADFIKRFANEEQDPTVVEMLYKRVSEILTPGEEIRYIAVQKKPLVNVSPDAVVLTTRRFIVYKPSLLGTVSFQDHAWRELSDVRLNEAILGADIWFQTIRNEFIKVSYLPKVQARKLYSIAQQMEEQVREERRHRDLEDKRAAAGGIVMQSATPAVAPSQPTDPMERLQKLKAMADSGLITAAEYEAKKADILSSL